MTFCEYCEFGIHAPIALDCPNHANRKVGMGGKKLYHVTLEYEVMVVAEDEKAAEEVAENHVREIIEMPPDYTSTREITEAAQIPSDWRSCYPFRDDGQQGKQRCSELIEK